MSGLGTSKKSVVGAVRNGSAYLRERRRESRKQNEDKRLFSGAGEMRKDDASERILQMFLLGHMLIYKGVKNQQFPLTRRSVAFSWLCCTAVES